CVGYQSQDDYRRMIEDVVLFLEGKTLDVRARLRERMLAASRQLDFERAAQLRDALEWLDQLEQPQTVELVGGGDADAIGFARDGDDACGVILRVRGGRLVAREHRFLENVEHETEGAVLAAFLVWFEAGRPKKAEYRRFRITGAPQDDFAAVREVVTRYLTRRRGEDKALPDLIVIDGGKGQLAAALEAARALGLETLPIVSLAKREEEVFLPTQAEPLRLSRRSLSL